MAMLQRVADSRVFLPVVAIGFLVYFSAYVSVTGIRYAKDTWDYDNWSNVLLFYEFDYGKTFSLISFYVSETFYAVFITLLAVAKLVFGSDWDLAVVALNIFAMSATAFMIVCLVRSLHPSITAMIVALVCPALTIEMFVWTRALMTDVLGVLAQFVVFTSVCCAYLSSRQNVSWLIWIVAGFATCLTIFIRPTGISVAVSFFVLASLMMVVERKPRFKHILVYAVVGMALSGLIVHAFLIFYLNDIALVSTSEIMHETRRLYMLGYTVHGRDFIALPPPNAVSDILIVTIAKVFLFFLFITDTYSLPHNLLNFAIHVPLYGIVLFASWTVVFRPNTFPWQISRTIRLGLMFVCVTAGFHAVVGIDWDWRYRAPCYPVLISIAALSTPQFLNWCYGLVPANLRRHFASE